MARAKKKTADNVVTSRLDARRRAAADTSGAGYAEKQAEIVDAAVHMFADRGYDASNLSDIAAAVDIERATLYYYFKSKAALLAFAMTNVLSGAVDELSEVAAGEGDALTKLKGAISLVLRAMTEKYPLVTLYFQDDIWRSPSHTALIAPLREDEDRIVEMFTNIIEAGQLDGTMRADHTAEEITRIVFGSLAWTYRWLKPGCGLDIDEVVTSFCAILSTGVAAPKTSRRGGTAGRARKTQ